jgi:hypothetical protein
VYDHFDKIMHVDTQLTVSKGKDDFTMGASFEMSGLPVGNIFSFEQLTVMMNVVECGDGTVIWNGYIGTAC